MRTALCWVITQQMVVISYRRFGTTCGLHLQGSRITTIRCVITHKSAVLFSGFMLPVYRATDIRIDSPCLFPTNCKFVGTHVYYYSCDMFRLIIISILRDSADTKEHLKLKHTVVYKIQWSKHQYLILSTTKIRLMLYNICARFCLYFLASQYLNANSSLR
jgi:hypothetical protein